MHSDVVDQSIIPLQMHLLSLLYQVGHLRRDDSILRVDGRQEVGLGATVVILHQQRLSIGAHQPHILSHRAQSELVTRALTFDLKAICPITTQLIGKKKKKVLSYSPCFQWTWSLLSDKCKEMQEESDYSFAYTRFPHLPCSYPHNDTNYSHGLF